jgi:hypothetical protein
MSVRSKPSTGAHSLGSKVSDTALWLGSLLTDRPYRRG